MISISLAMTSLLQAVPVTEAIPRAAASAEAPSPIQHGIPGGLPGTERWLVTFKKRSFDLSTFRKAVHGGASGSEVARIVKDLEKEVQGDQAEFSRFIDGLGGDVVAQWWIVNGCALDIPFAKLNQVRNHPDVLFLEPDREVEPVAFIKTATNSANHNADAVHAQGYKGAGVTVAILDTGIDISVAGTGRHHKAFHLDGDPKKPTRVKKAVSMPGAIGPDDVHNHGTGVTSVSAGAKWNTSTTSDEGHAPHAGITSYCVAMNSRGSSTSTILTSAWQAVAADAATYKIAAANNSYSGSPSPLSTTQRAIDSLALNANVLPVVAAGNFASSTRSSQSCANGLAVAATNATVKTIASFSSKGPLYGDTQRFYPDMSANGVLVVMAKRDNEATYYRASGTSFASPQVAGAASLFRSVDTKATALQTKAALLASTEDISKQNPTLNRNAYGMGYLRDDRLIDLALRRNGGMLQTQTLTPAVKTRKVSFSVLAGKAYAVAIAWNRFTLTSTSWSNIDLRILRGGNPIGASSSPRNLYEKVVFISKSAGTVEIEISAKTLEVASVPVALAAIQVPAPFIRGSATAFGLGCKGTGKVSGVRNVVPTSATSSFGSSRTSVILGYYPHRSQQIFNANLVPGTFTATGFAFRHDNASLRSINNYWIDFQASLGYTTASAFSISTTFANNLSEALTAVIAKRRLNLPYWTSLNTSPSNWLIKVPFDKPFVYKAQTGKNLIMDTIRWTASTGTSYAWYHIDAAVTSGVGRNYSKSPTASFGSRTLSFAAVVGFLESAGTGAIPALSGSNSPEIGRVFSTSITQAAPIVPAILVVGASNQKWGNLTLPFDLAPLGSPGCKLLTSIDIMSAAVTTSTQGGASYSMGIPNNKNLIQAGFFLQCLVIDLKANQGGIVTTNGLTAIIGGQP